MTQPTDIPAAKAVLRSCAKTRRATLDPAYRQAASAALVTHVAHILPTLHPTSGGPRPVIGAFMPIGEEISPLPLMGALENDGYRLALPVMMGKTEPLQFRAYAPGDPLVAAVWGIREPGPDQLVLQPDVLFIALLAFDAQGYRLGYGGGYYDRTIRRLKMVKTVVTIGIAFDEQRVDAVPRLDYDERLDWILTPTGARRAT